MASFILRSVEDMSPYYACFPTTLPKMILPILLRFWVSDDEIARTSAFLAIRELCVSCPYPFIDLCLKGVYLYFEKECGEVNHNSIQKILFLTKGIVDLYGIDLTVSYQHAFMYIRELTIALKTAMAVLNFRFCICFYFNNTGKNKRNIKVS